MSLSYCPLVLAIEFPAPVRPAVYFERALAQPLAGQLAFEIAKQLPELKSLGLAWMAGCYDQAQLLRPGFPVFQALFDLYRAGVRDPLENPQVLTLQALRGEAPLPTLKVDERLLGGTICFVPLVLTGTTSVIAEVRSVLEARLLETGLTDARTAWMLNQALTVDAEHARLMTLDDLAALNAAQLEHAGLGELSPLIEAALFYPERDLPERQTAQGMRLAWQAGRACLGLQALDEHGEPEAFVEKTLRERQANNLLQAHALPLELRYEVPCGRVEAEPAGLFWLHWLAEGNVAKVVGYLHPALGIAYYQLLDEREVLLGRAYPLAPGAHAALMQRFADTAPRMQLRGFEPN